MADQKHDIILFGGVDQAPASFFGSGQRLFHHAVNAFVQKEFADVRMGDGSGDDADGINLFGNFLHAGKYFYAECFSGFLGGFGKNVVNADEFDVRQRFVSFKMVLAHHAGADDRNFDFSHAEKSSFLELKTQSARIYIILFNKMLLTCCYKMLQKIPRLLRLRDFFAG